MCAFYLVTSVVNLIIEILEKLGPVAYGLDAVFIVFYVRPRVLCHLK